MKATMKRLMAVATVTAALIVSAQSPALAVIGPEGYPVVQGDYFPNAVSFPDGTRTPVSRPYQWLNRGQSWTFGNVHLVFQSDQNVVMYRRGDHSRHYWKTNTRGSGATQLLFQRDGNLVLYTAGYARPVWRSQSQNRCTSTEEPLLSLQSDSNMVIYCGRVSISGGATFFDVRPVWSTGTDGV
jgi:hypothetical protein